VSRAAHRPPPTERAGPSNRAAPRPTNRAGPQQGVDFVKPPHRHAGNLEHSPPATRSTTASARAEPGARATEHDNRAARRTPCVMAARSNRQPAIRFGLSPRAASELGTGKAHRRRGACQRCRAGIDRGRPDPARRVRRLHHVDQLRRRHRATQQPPRHRSRCRFRPDLWKGGPDRSPAVRIKGAEPCVTWSIIIGASMKQFGQLAHLRFQGLKAGIPSPGIIVIVQIRWRIARRTRGATIAVSGRDWLRLQIDRERLLTRFAMVVPISTELDDLRVAKCCRTCAKTSAGTSGERHRLRIGDRGALARSNRPVRPPSAALRIPQAHPSASASRAHAAPA